MAAPKVKVYICGKVTGEPMLKTALKFAKAEIALKNAGFEPINPLEVVGEWTTNWNEAMRKCIAAMMEADALFCLYDVEDSKGAAIEMSLAHRLDIPQFLTLEGLKKEFLDGK